MRNEEAPPKHGRSWNISSPKLDDGEEDDGDGEDRVARSPTPPSSVERPGGRKGSKEMLKRQAELKALKSKIDELIKSRNEYAEKRRQEKLEIEKNKLKKKRARWKAMQ